MLATKNALAAPTHAGVVAGVVVLLEVVGAGVFVLLMEVVWGGVVGAGVLELLFDVVGAGVLLDVVGDGVLELLLVVLLVGSYETLA